MRRLLSLLLVLTLSISSTEVLWGEPLDVAADAHLLADVTDTSDAADEETDAESEDCACLCACACAGAQPAEPPAFTMVTFAATAEADAPLLPRRLFPSPAPAPALRPPLA